MKIFKSLFAVLFLSFMVSCSSDDSSDPVNSNPETDSFTFKVDGQAKTVSNWQAERREYVLIVNGVTTDGYSVQMIFNENGNIGQVIVNSAEYPWMLNYDYNRSAYFNLDLSSLDEAQDKLAHYHHTQG